MLNYGIFGYFGEIFNLGYVTPQAFCGLVQSVNKYSGYEATGQNRPRIRFFKNLDIIDI